MRIVTPFVRNAINLQPYTYLIAAIYILPGAIIILIFRKMIMPSNPDNIVDINTIEEENHLL